MALSIYSIQSLSALPQTDLWTQQGLWKRLLGVWLVDRSWSCIAGEFGGAIRLMKNRILMVHTVQPSIICHSIKGGAWGGLGWWQLVFCCELVGPDPQWMPFKRSEDSSLIRPINLAHFLCGPHNHTSFRFDGCDALPLSKQGNKKITSHSMQGTLLKDSAGGAST